MSKKRVAKPHIMRREIMGLTIGMSVQPMHTMAAFKHAELLRLEFLGRAMKKPGGADRADYAWSDMAQWENLRILEDYADEMEKLLNDFEILMSERTLHDGMDEEYRGYSAPKRDEIAKTRELVRSTRAKLPQPLPVTL